MRSGYLLDYRVRPEKPGRCNSVDLDSLCSDAMHIHHQIWNGNKLEDIPCSAERLTAIGNMVSEEMPITAQSIIDYLAGLNELLDGKERPALGTFRSWLAAGHNT
jgi:hypothetical protein